MGVPELSTKSKLRLELEMKKGKMKGKKKKVLLVPFETMQLPLNKFLLN